MYVIYNQEVMIKCYGCGCLRRGDSKEISKTDKFTRGLALCKKCKKEYGRRLFKAYLTGRVHLTK
jgi:hypothetical protein